MAREVLALGEQLAAEATCPVCLELFSRPVLTECGHSFCERCLRAVLGSGPAACPQCRAALSPGSLRPDRSLGAVAGLAGALEEAARRPRCPEHGEPLALFCEPCAAPLCALCMDGPAHRPHRARAAESAARELRETLQSNLVFLQKAREELKPKGEPKSDELLHTVALEEERLQNTFEELEKFLQEQKRVLLAQLGPVSQELVKRRSEHSSRVAERESLLDALIADIEKKRDQPEVEFLMDVGKVLSSCEAAKAPIPEAVSPELQRSVETLSETCQLVLGTVAKFKENLLSNIDREREKVTLDPETASPFLLLSADHRTLRLAEGFQNLPNTPRRFTDSPSVLGSRGFTSGRHYWELEVGKGHSWAVGVALESVQRKDSLSIALGKIWALRLDWEGRYTALHGLPAPLAPQEKPRRIRVHLDYEGGRVTFYNAENMEQILQFETSFTEKVFPYFWLWSAETFIRLCD
ncbi:E3 ubiquitin-protein ligase TRIM7-like [Neopelma chrysocephalum]|uniref:E3 ubiquitin-protein ligase TRIM7-like n=1 Tax=Neopelma chrysocephalum TaxID=114329 RepID=UPI000FCD197C|nr:E3 ubiquitin-protein ligase TRIM7-like [Neopelma chrysocephalum]